MKNNGKWKDRVAVQRAFDTRNPQDIYHIINFVITPEQAVEIENALVPPKSAAEQIDELTAIKEKLQSLEVDTEVIDAKIEELSR